MVCLVAAVGEAAVWLAAEVWQAGAWPPEVVSLLQVGAVVVLERRVWEPLAVVVVLEHLGVVEAWEHLGLVEAWEHLGEQAGNQTEAEEEKEQVFHFEGLNLGEVVLEEQIVVVVVLVPGEC